MAKAMSREPTLAPTKSYQARLARGRKNLAAMQAVKQKVPNQSPASMTNLTQAIINKAAINAKLEAALRATPNAPLSNPETIPDKE
jgi:hypothetical protein